MNHILIKNGIVVTPKAVVKADILIRDQIIARIGPSLAANGAKVIDARGRVVIPGGIDVHTHFNLDTGIAKAQDDFFTGTRAAAMGGTTTIVDHPGFGPDGCDIFHQIDLYHGFAKECSVIDYSFHGLVQHLDSQVLADIPKLADQGVTSVKAYMTYGHRFDRGMLARLFETTQKHGVLVAVHAEDHAMVEKLGHDLVSNGKTGPVYHAQSRPGKAEAKAVQEAVETAAKTNAPLYIVHLSTAQGLEIIQKARKAGQNVMAETCPQYLVLDKGAYNEPDLGGLKYVMSPPLRAITDQNALLEGVKNETISTIATDHCPFDFALKKRLGALDFTKCPGGIPGVETRIPLMFSLLVDNLKKDLNRFCRLVSENPARIMGLYPQKGILAKGSDADIVIMDQDKKVTITHDLLHENVDYTPFQAMKVKGWPVLTMVRGSIVAQGGRFKGKKGCGRFIKRKPRDWTK